MRIAIHYTKNSFCDRWIEYCNQQNIKYKIVDAYSNNIISILEDCDAFMWHFHQANPKDILFAKQLLYSLEARGLKVFPNFSTAWHFDDKVGQKYLLESLGIEFVKTFVFYTKPDAKKFIRETTFPLVHKLRNGAGSENVRLIKNKKSAIRFIRIAFGRGFNRYPPLANLSERIRKFLIGKATYRDIIKGFIRLVVKPKHARIISKEKGYIYFQEFIPNNQFDIRVIVIGNKAFAIKRMVRKNDFRASGSGNILYEKENFNEDTIQLAFKISDILKSQCIAYDFVYLDRKPLIVEISYGFSPEGYDSCPGYWDKNLNWKEGTFNPYGWMIDLVIQ